MSRLALAARIAASRFASTRRRETRRAPHVWLPIALRWRRRRKQLEKSRLGRAARPAATWLSQIHLHLNLTFSDRTSWATFASHSAAARLAAHVHRHFHARLRELRRRDDVRSITREARRMETVATWAAPAAAAPLAPVHRHFQARLSELHRRDEVRSTARETLRTETVMNRQSTTVTSGAFAVPARRLEGSVFKVRRGLNPSAAQRAAAVAAADGLRTGPTSIATRILVDRAHRLLFRTTRENLRVSSSAMHERTRSVERLAHIRTRELRIVHRLASAIADSARNSAREGRTSQGVTPVRPQELVWRSAPRAAAEIDAEMRRVATHSAAAQQKVPVAAARSAGAALQLKDVDGALLDRLTDDVIRRVERRSRIERERRGL